MAELKAVYDKQDDIPESVENFRELYVEKNGKWELTGIGGVKTLADVQRIELGLKKERDDHKASKDRLAVWGDLSHDDVMAKLDRIAELEAAAGGKLDDAKIEELTSRRVDATLKSKVGPLEREAAKLRKELEEAGVKVKDYESREVRRTIHDRVRSALTSGKVLNEAHEDALILAERVFEVVDGAVVTRDGVGVTPGLDPAAWLGEIQDKRPHWWPPSSGGGALGSGRQNGGMVKNPWSHENWSVTEQLRVEKEKGSERAAQLAASAGSSLGGLRPSPKK